jgi:3-oxoacyl-[acyl-carrier protein] reductase
VIDGEPRYIINISSTSGVHGNAGQANYGLAKAGVVGLTKVVAKEWSPKFSVRGNTVAFGHILTRLSQTKEKGAFIMAKRCIRNPRSTARAGKEQTYPDIPLGRPGTATEATSCILEVASPLFSYVNG